MKRRFKDIIQNIDGYSPYDRLKRQVEALIAEVCFLEDVVIHLGAEEVLEKHRKARDYRDKVCD